MWWERLIPKSYLTKSSVCGVECAFSGDSIIFNYSVWQLKKNKLDDLIKGQDADLNSALKAIKKTNSPAVLCVTGKGVISKKIIFSENDSLLISDLVKQHFSTISITDFYIQFYKSSNNSGYLSICRKEQIDKLIEQFTLEKIECVNIFIGPLVCNALSNIISTYNRLSTNLYHLELKNGVIDDVHSSDDSESNGLKIDDLQIDPVQMIAFASGFSYLTRQEIYTSENTELNSLYSKHIEKLKTRILLFSLIAFLFVISAINSVLFFQKFEEHNILEVELSLYESKNSQITKLLDNYQKKKSLIEQAGIFDNKKLSIYADKIALSLPNDIVLRELYFNPEIGETEEDSLMDFQKNQLIIKGNCNKSLLLNEWVNVLKSQEFIKSVNLENFVFNSEGHSPNFTLKLETE